MNKNKKDEVLEKISQKLDKVTYGKLTIELRGPDRPVDIILEDRERIFTDKNNNISEKNN